MLFLLSPAKTLDYDTPLPAFAGPAMSTPLFVEQASEVMAVLRRKKPRQVAQLMELSDALATLNVERYAAWQAEHTLRNSRPAAFAFAGDVYDGLQAASLTEEDLRWAQQHLVILSGLYGVLRPLDALQPYRLEMGTALAVKRRKDLYAYWGDRLAHHLDQRLAGQSDAVVVNLASVEYARAALRPALQARVVHCQFEDWKGQGYKIISFFAKRARGAFARWAVQQRLTDPSALGGFAADGYALAPEISDAQRLVFRRRLPQA